MSSRGARRPPETYGTYGALRLSSPGLRKDTVPARHRRRGAPPNPETAAAVRFLSIEPLLEDLGEIDLQGIDWVIVGGESGPGARPMRRSWVVSIRRQCRKADIPFFFKQWGGVQKGRNGRHLDGRTYDELPDIEPASPPSSVERSRRRREAEVSLQKVA